MVIPHTHTSPNTHMSIPKFSSTNDSISVIVSSKLDARCRPALPLSRRRVPAYSLTAVPHSFPERAAARCTTVFRCTFPPLIASQLSTPSAYIHTSSLGNPSERYLQSVHRRKHRVRMRSTEPRRHAICNRIHVLPLVYVCGSCPFSQIREHVRITLNNFTERYA